MLFHGIEICCPACTAELARRQDRAGEALECESCHRVFPVLFGIPDLRTRPDPYIGIEEDRAKGLALAGQFEKLSFAELVTYYYEHTPVVPPQHARLYIRGLLSGGDRAKHALACWEDAAAPAGVGARSLLEVGCGTGPGLVAAASRYGTLAGVDIAFRWLVVAKKRLAEAGLDIPLFCACAEALPFPRKSFDRVLAESVLEHVYDQQRALTECYRVLRPLGFVYVATPNQFSLGPDPQTGIWAGGMLPQSWVARRVERAGGIPPKRSLLSVRSLRQRLLQGGFRATRIWPAAIPAAQRAMVGRGMRAAIDIYMALRRLPVSRDFLLHVGPLLYAVAEKPAAEGAPQL